MGSRRRSAREAVDLPRHGAGNLRRSSRPFPGFHHVPRNRSGLTVRQPKKRWYTAVVANLRRPFRECPTYGVAQVQTYSSWRTSRDNGGHSFHWNICVNRPAKQNLCCCNVEGVSGPEKRKSSRYFDTISCLHALRPSIRVITNGKRKGYLNFGVSFPKKE